MKNVLDATEASNNTPSTFQEHTHIIDHTCRLHMCTYANIKVDVAATLQKEKFSFKCAANKQRFKHSNLLPNPNTDTQAHKVTQSIYNVHVHVITIPFCLCFKYYSEGNYIHVHVLGDYAFPSILIVFENY